jgi:NAD(P)-dependent dehydrogenase (short-subunit alcohol dehydrogenase family)
VRAWWVSDVTDILVYESILAKIIFACPAIAFGGRQTAAARARTISTPRTVFNRWSSADEVAYLASDTASYVSGSTLFVDGGWTAVDGPPTGLTQLAGASSGN